MIYSQSLRLEPRENHNRNSTETQPPDVYQNISLAPNGRSVAMDKTDIETLSQCAHVWTYDLQRNSAKRLTFDQVTAGLKEERI